MNISAVSYKNHHSGAQGCLAPHAARRHYSAASRAGIKRRSTCCRCRRMAAAAPLRSRSDICRDDPFVVGKTVMVGGRARAVGAQAAPHHGPSNCVQHIEQTEEHVISTRLGDLPVEQIVEVFVLPPWR
ncbi:hypothetical protein FHS21_005106 [Phyllobacterium trifolii]|uniref:Uncharacterized protein n=1 Tax=Phyllobacterium trifolii TaxID=300193 RepID=A0A839UCD0_9HYPH|nr:hypothetical protein [Phyllobacterium trifolii]